MGSITEVDMSERKRKDEASVARCVMNDNDNKTRAKMTRRESNANEESRIGNIDNK